MDLRPGILAAAFFLQASAWAALPATCTAASGAAMLPLVELFTSEGCDSCPPADAWLSATFPPGGMEARAAVLAFHVDYWDRLGWVDRFARPAFTARQNAAARASGAPTVYTPQVLVQGRDVGLWRNASVLRAVQEAARGTPRARIVVTARPEGDAVVVAIEATLADRSAREVEIRVALAESGLVSSVTAGENRGARLGHDHVVRAFAAGVPFDAAGRVNATIRLERDVERGIHPEIVAFAQDRRTGTVLQSLVLPLCKAG